MDTTEDSHTQHTAVLRWFLPDSGRKSQCQGCDERKVSVTSDPLGDLERAHKSGQPTGGAQTGERAEAAVGLELWVGRQSGGADGLVITERNPQVLCWKQRPAPSMGG